MALQRLVGNQVVNRILADASRGSVPAVAPHGADGIIQRVRATEEVRVDLVGRIMALLKAQNFAFALKVVEEATKNATLDADDLVDIYKRLYTDQDLAGTLAGWYPPPKGTAVPVYETCVTTDLPAKIEEMKSAVVPVPVTGTVVTEDKWTELKAGPGKSRIQVPTDKAGACALLPLASIRWSQSDVKATTSEVSAPSLGTIVGYMASGGWKGDPAEVVQFVSDPTQVNGVPVDLGIAPGYVSKDNRRLLCAYTAGLSTVPCLVMGLTDALPFDTGDKLKKALYWDKTNRRLHMGNSGEGWTNKGKPVEPTRWVLVMAKDKKPANYGELVIIRTANQPGVKATGNGFTVGGSSLPPYMKI